MARVFEFGDLRIEHSPQDRSYERYAPGELKRFPSRCQHNRMTYDDNGNIIRCSDCGDQIDAYWAALHVFRSLTEAFERLDQRQKTVEEGEARSLIHRSALKVEDAWRRRKYVPTCPHCWKAIGPEDGFGNGHKHKEHYANEVLPLEMKPQLEVVAEK